MGRVNEVRSDVGSGVIGQVEGGCHDNSCRVCGRAGSLGLPFHIQEYLLTNYDKNFTSEIHVLCAQNMDTKNTQILYMHICPYR